MPSRLGFVPSGITLGSAQLGMPYGIVAVAQPSEAQVHGILDAAAAAGITTIDTARAYGDAEARIGRWLARHPRGIDIITKVPGLPAGNAAERRAALRTHLAESSRALGVKRLALVLAHEESDLDDPAVVEAFSEAVRDDLIGGYGASAYSVETALRLIETVPLAALQLPANVLDRRFEAAGVFTAARERGIAVFVRSVFLKGALVGDPAALPAHLGPLASAARRIQQLARDVGCALPDLLIPPVRDIPGANSLVIGVDNAAQLVPIIAASRASTPSVEVMQQMLSAASGLPREMVDPSSWRSLERRGQAQAGS
jgi:aryl-alcohol dehydrogenase-like predicted oxidoreductase